jgi:uncharacterized DUF497 family protein
MPCIPQAVGNRRRHGVSFEEAQTAFGDEAAILIVSKGGRNVYARRLKRSVTSRLDEATIA